MGRVWFFSLYVYIYMVYPRPPPPASKKMPNDCPPFNWVQVGGGGQGGGVVSRRVNETFFLSFEDSDKTQITHFKCATKITEY